MIDLDSATGNRLGTPTLIEGATYRPARRVLGRRQAPTGPLGYLRAAPAWMLRGYQRVNASDLASAVAFQAMVVVLPMFLLLISVAGLFLQNSSVLLQAIRVIAYILPPGVSGEAFTAAFEARRNSGLFGALSLLGFAWVGTGFVSTLARSMNRIYGVPNAGYLKEKQRGFIVILLFGTFFVIASSASIITTFFVARQSDLPPVFRQWFLATGETQILSFAVGFVAAFGLFLTLYRLVPNAGQRMRDVWPGTALSSLLFVLVSLSLPIYLQATGGSNRFGVALGLVTLMVATFYVLAHVILFGCYVNATWQRHRRDQTRRQRIVVTDASIHVRPIDPQAARADLPTTPLL